MVPVLAVICLALLATGLSLCTYALRKYATETERQRSRAGDGWGRLWKGPRRFTAHTGYRLYVAGIQLVIAAALLVVVLAWNL